MPHIVLCVSSRAGVCVKSTHRCCAARRFLIAARETARRRGVRPWCFARWLWRAFGTLRVARYQKNGVAAASLPCVLCRRALDATGARWTALTRDGCTVNERNAPPSQPTSRQRVCVFV
jgi:hypothetical protein